MIFFFGFAQLGLCAAAGLIGDTLWPKFIVAMHPFQHGLFLAIDLLGPLAGIFLPTADHVQRLKPFSTAKMFGFKRQAPHLFRILVPFGKVWSDHWVAPG